MSTREVRAVIDVGTNSVKLLVAEIGGENGGVHPIFEGSHQTRLGQGFYETHILQTSAIGQTADAVATFARKAAQWHPARLEVIGTSAARDAINQAELLNAIQTAAGLPVRIISGQEEAEWAHRGVTTDAQFSRHPLLVLDVGGGSTEFLLGSTRTRVFGRSFPLGSVRLFERSKLSDPPQPAELAACELDVRSTLENDVMPVLGPELDKLEPGTRWVSTGGMSTLLARMRGEMDDFDRERIEGIVLAADWLHEQKRRLWSLPLEARKKIIGLPPNRADIILGGIVIFSEVMSCFDLKEIKVSTRGIRFAAVLET